MSAPRAGRRTSTAALASLEAPYHPAPEMPPTAAALVMTLARLFVPFVAAELRGATSAEEGDGWIDQACSPLGRRLHCALARAGTLPARKMGRRWLVRRADLDAYIEEHGRAAARTAAEPDATPDADEAEVRALLAECGMVAVAPAAVPKPGKQPRARARHAAR